MASSLHGGGVPFISQLTIKQISDANTSVQDVDGLKFSSPVTTDGKPASLTLKKDGDIGDDDRLSYRIEFDGPARSVLGLPQNGQSARTKSVRAATDSLTMNAASPNLYFKLVDTTGIHDPLPDCLLQKIAGNMHAGAAVGIAAGTPATYTYFGQFIAHDLTHIVFSGTPGDEWSHRSHALDLDSIFDPLPADVAPFGDLDSLPDFPTSHVCIGQTNIDKFEDIPRTVTGFPAITDARNDNNLGVAQLFVAITRFIHKLQKIRQFSDVNHLKVEASRYLQSIVLTDYLPTICDPDTLEDIKNNGRKVVFRDGVPSVFQLPTEFAAACFRFGHSMVNSEYMWGDKVPNATLGSLLNFTHLGSGLARNPVRLKDKWIVDWHRFGDPKTKAAHIDTRLSFPLGTMDKKWFDANSGIPVRQYYDLAEITLWRAKQLQLANAQQLISHVESEGVAINALSGGGALFGTDNSISAGLCLMQITALNTNTPIWLYVLREAELAGTGKLGPLGSRIVAESLMVAVEAAPNNIITGDALSVAKQFGAAKSSEFKLADLISAQCLNV